MAILIGKIGALRELKQRLAEEGLDEFNSVGELQRFQKNYPAIREAILSNSERELNNDIAQLEERLKELTEQIPEVKSHIRQELRKLLTAKKQELVVLKSRIEKSNRLLSAILYLRFLWL